MSVFEHAQLGKEFTWDAIKCRDLSLRKGHQLPGGGRLFCHHLVLSFGSPWCFHKVTLCDFPLDLEVGSFESKYM